MKYLYLFLFLGLQTMVCATTTAKESNWQQAQILYEKGDYLSSLSIYEKLLKKKPSYWMHYNMANTHAQIFLKNMTENPSQHLAYAIWHFEKSLAINPSNKKAKKNLNELKKYTNLIKYETFDKQNQKLISFLDSSEKVKTLSIIFFVIASFLFSFTFFWSEKKETFRLWIFIFLGNYIVVLGAHFLIKKYPREKKEYIIIAKPHTKLYESAEENDEEKSQNLPLPVGLKAKILLEENEMKNITFWQNIGGQWRPFYGWIKNEEVLQNLKR